MHPRITVHEVCFPETMDIPAMLDWAERHGIAGIGLFSLRRKNGWAEAVAQVTAAGSKTRIAYLCKAAMFRLDAPESWDASVAQMIEVIDAAQAMGSRLVYVTTGPAGTLEFEGAAEALAQAAQPVVRHAQARGVRLMTETTGPAMCFTHFLHTFADTVFVAEKAGLELCLDLHPTWHERAIRQKIVDAVDKVALVQVADHVPRNMSVVRDVVGEGIVPLERLLATIFDAGYDGPVDLELFGRPPESALVDVLTSCERLSELLYRLGA